MQQGDKAMNTSSRRQTAVLISFFALCTGIQAAAATLDAEAAKSLISGRMWQQPQPHGTGQLYWSWNADGSVCLRTDGKTSKCADTGTWKLGGDRLCYKLTWYGKASGRQSACFRISDKQKGLYEALQDNGLTLFEFSVVE